MDGPFYVTFEISRQYRRVATPDHERWTLDDIKDGFWITAHYVLCRESQGQYWVPPSKIVIVEKRRG